MQMRNGRIMRTAEKSTQKESQIGKRKKRKIENTKACEIGPYFCHSFIVSFVRFFHAHSHLCISFSSAFSLFTSTERAHKQHWCNIQLTEASQKCFFGSTEMTKMKWKIWTSTWTRQNENMKCNDVIMSKRVLCCLRSSECPSVDRRAPVNVIFYLLLWWFSLLKHICCHCMFA